MGTRYIGFREVQQSIDHFIAYLDSQGFSVPTSSRFASALKHSRQVIELWEDQSIPENFQIHKYMNDFANLWWISSLISKIEGSEFEENVIPNLTLLTKADPFHLTAGKQSTERDGLFEVILACICSLFATEVQFMEPDIICSYNSVRWGIACKVAYGSDRETAKDIRRAIKQIEKADVELGLIAIQMTNKYPHDKMYKIDSESDDIISLHSEKLQQKLFLENLLEVVRPIEIEVTKNLKAHPRELKSINRGVFFLASKVSYFRKRRVIMSGSVLSKLSQLEATPEYDLVNKINQPWQRF